MRKGREIWRMVGLVLVCAALSGCPAPASLFLLNESGQRLSLSPCNGAPISIESGEEERVYLRRLHCYRNRAFVIRTEQGENWRYAALPGRAANPADREAVAEFAPYGVQAKIDRDGGIYLGKRVGFDAQYYGLYDYPQDQPAGYPLKPVGSQ